MKVGIVTAPLDFGPSGPGVYLENLCRRIVDRDDVNPYLIHYQDSNSSLYDNAREIILPRTPGRFERGLSKLDLDVLHYNYVPYKRPLVFALDVKLVVTVHGDLPFVLPEYATLGRQYIGVPVQRLYSAIGLLDRIDAFVGVSKTTANNFGEALNIPDSKITTAYSGVDEQFEPVDQARKVVQSRYGIDSPYVLNINNYMEKKNRDTLIRAFRRIRDVQPDLSLVLAGGGWENSGIPDLIADLNLRDSIVELGFVPTEELPLLYSGAEIFVNPTLHETFGLTNLEAMACNCPVITSDRFAIPEIVDDGAVLLSDPLDVDAVAETTLDLVADERRRTDLATKGRKRAQKFTWERTADQVVDVYRVVSRH